MNLKRASLFALAAFVIPGMAMAQMTQRVYVEKNFEDGNDGDVIVSYECNDGLPSSDSITLSSGKIGHTFVIEELSETELVECVFTEVGAAAMGYDANYFMEALGDAISDDACTFVSYGDVGAGLDDDDGYVMFSPDGEAACLISNDPLPVAIVVSKEWDLTGTNDDFENTTAKITVASDAFIAGAACDPDGCIKILTFEGEDPASQTVLVNPDDYDGVYVYLSEKGVDSYVDATNDCGGTVVVRANQGGSCHFTNAVFYEGIPTLSQYGLAIMALLMLGVGFVGFRRFV